MHQFKELSQTFQTYFKKEHFPEQPSTLYHAARHILNNEGKRVRPILVLLGNELFDEIKQDAYPVAAAIELFHNFSLIHDDIMDAAPLRRNQPTVHSLYGQNSALLAGDVMLVKCYDYLVQVQPSISSSIIKLFNTTAAQVCEGQQLDMDFEKQEEVTMDEYINMISLKTSVLLAAALQAGAIIGGAGLGNQQHLYSFGENLGIAFQVQDDYLDTFGEDELVGKQVGGDIRQNKKTFLAIHTWANATSKQKEELRQLQTHSNSNYKVEQTRAIMVDCGADEYALQLKQHYFEKAIHHLNEVAVLKARKQPLLDLAHFLITRNH